MIIYLLHTSLTIGYLGLSTKVEAFDTSLPVVTIDFAYEVGTVSDNVYLFAKAALNKATILLGSYFLLFQRQIK